MQMLKENATEAATNYQVHKFGSEPHDLCIRIGLQSFNLHRSIAAMKSNYFNDLMKKKSLADVIDLNLEDVTADTFLEICRWMYGTPLQIAAHNLCAVWHTSKKLKILDLVEKCRDYLNSISTRHRSSHDQQRNSQVSLTNKGVELHQKSQKNVTFAPATLSTGHRPPAIVAEPHSETEGTPKRKPVSLEKLLRKRTVEKNVTILPTSVNDEWITISQEEIIGSVTEHSVQAVPQDKVPNTCEKRLPRPTEPEHWTSKIQANPNMLLVKTSEQPKLAFLVDRSHLVSNSGFLRAELGMSDRNSVTLRHTDNQTVSNVLQWSLGGSHPLTSANVRSVMQLTNQLNMAELSSKCLEFWRKCISGYAAEVSSAALMSLARSDWPLSGPYPFLIDLIASRKEYPAESPCIISIAREGICSQAQISAKALTGRNPHLIRNITIPSSYCEKAEVPKPEPSSSKPAIPASIKILGLRRTLEMLNSRKTRAKNPVDKPEETGGKPTTKPVPISKAKADERKASPNTEVSNKTVPSLRSLANRRESVRKKTNADNEIK